MRGSVEKTRSIEKCIPVKVLGSQILEAKSRTMILGVRCYRARMSQLALVQCLENTELDDRDLSKYCKNPVQEQVRIDSKECEQPEA